MIITSAEFKDKFNEYLTLAASEDICIKCNGKVVAKLSSPYKDRVRTATSLAGIIPADITLEEARAKRLSEL